jgi:hypothetical protein
MAAIYAAREGPPGHLRERQGARLDAAVSAHLGHAHAKTNALATAAQKLAERMYAAGQATGAGPAEGAQASGGAKGGDDNVVDAEFEEVKDK